MADINIAERRLPQDGRMSLTVGGKPVDLRVATLPTVYGEKVVMRILDKGQALLSLDDLGFLPDVARALRELVPQAVRHDPRHRADRLGQVDDALRHAQHPQRRRRATSSRSRTRSSTGCPGINQMQINPKAGLTFAAALRSILRADPDIVLVGEIRDRETATIAVEASLTGHLVLSTLHTNDAASTPHAARRDGRRAVPRRRARSTACVAQRLARRLCDRCKEPYQPSEAELIEAGWPMEQIDGTDWPVLYRHVGCGALRQDRLPGPLRPPRGDARDRGDRAADRRAPLTDDIKKVAVIEGMIPLRADGLAKVGNGITSLEEIFRVVT